MPVRDPMRLIIPHPPPHVPPLMRLMIQDHPPIPRHQLVTDPKFILRYPRRLLAVVPLHKVHLVPQFDSVPIY